MRVLIVVGEASGDSHAAKVARRLREGGASITAVGGDELQAAGAELVEHIESLSVLGFVEVFRNLPRFVALKRRIESLLRLSDGLVGRSLLGGHGSTDGFAELMRYVEQVWRMMRPQVMFNISQQPRGFIAGRVKNPPPEGVVLG